jgi:WD40 repeat protein
MRQQWQTVRVFISSTFRDMHAERDHLVKVAFPRLRQWCEEHRLHLVEIDLRWGVPKEEAENGRALEICLREIDGSRPFFVCLLGGRYGWVLERPDAEHYPGAAGRAGCSITHLEIIHAVEQSLGEAEPRPPCDHAFFYFRKPAAVPRPAALPSATPEQRRAHAATFFEQGTHEQGMLARLKKRLWRQFRSLNRVYQYGGRWDADAANPEDDALRGRLTGLEELGSRVEADLKGAIAARFAEHLAAPAEADPLEQELALHEAFLVNRTQVHVPRPDVEIPLSRYADGPEEATLLVSGPPGSGKSALLAHWIDARRRDRGGEVLVHRFIGASPASTNLTRLLRSVCEEVVRRLGLTEEVEEIVKDSSGQAQRRVRVQPMEVPLDPAQLLRKWPRFLEEAGGKGRVVVVLDAVNQLDRGTDPGRAPWLPRRLPPGIRLIVSALDQGASAAGGEWLAALRHRGFAEIPVPALVDAERRTIIRALPSIFCKTLDAGQVDRLLRNGATCNPLFLTVALQELRVFGSFEKLTPAIDALPQLNGRGDVDAALDALFGQVLARLEREHEAEAPGLTVALFGSLASAREGLSEEELGLLTCPPDQPGHEARLGVMQAVLRQVRPYLARKGTASGALLDFYHRSFWKAVRTRYLPTPAARRATHGRLAAFFGAQPSFRPGGGTLAANERKAVELPWQLWSTEAAAEAGSGRPDWSILVGVLTDLELIEAKCAAGRTFELLGDYRRVLKEESLHTDERRRLDAFHRFVGAECHTLVLHPGQVLQLAMHLPAESPPGREARRRQEAGLETRPWLRCLNHPSRPGGGLFTFSAQGAKCHAVALSPDGARVLTAWGDRTLRVWDAETGEEVLALTAEEEVLAFAWAPEGATLATVSGQGTVRLRDALSGEETLRLEVGRKLEGPRLQFSRNGRRMAVLSERPGVWVWDLPAARRVFEQQVPDEDPELRRWVASQDLDRLLGVAGGNAAVWDAATGTKLWEWKSKARWLESYCFSPDGRRVLLSLERKAALFDAATGTEELDLVGQQWTSFGRSAQFSPDGALIVSGHGPRLVLWETRTGRIVHTLGRNERPSETFSFSPDGARLAGVDDSDHSVLLWDVASGEVTARLVGHSDYVHGLAFTPRGDRLVSWGSEPTVRVWDATLPISLGEPRAARADAIRYCAFTPDGSRVVSEALSLAHDGKHLQMWDGETGEPLATLAEPRDEVYAWMLLRGGHWVLSARGKKHFQLWDVRDGSQFPLSEQRRLDIPTWFTADGFVTPGTPSNLLLLWDAVTTRSIYEILEQHRRVLKVDPEEERRAVFSRTRDKFELKGHAFSLDGTRLVTGVNVGKHLCLWDVPRLAPLATLEDPPREGHLDCVNACAISPGQSRIASQTSEAVNLWEAATGRRVVVDTGGSWGSVLPLAFAPHGRFLSAKMLDGVGVWRIPDAARVAFQPGGDCPEQPFSPDGDSLVVRQADGVLTLWDLAAGRSRASMPGHTKELTAAIFSRDGALLATTSSDGALMLWRTDDGRLIGRYRVERPLRCVAFDAGGTRLAAGDEDGRVHLLRIENWDLEPAIRLIEEQMNHARNPRDRQRLAALLGPPAFCNVTGDGDGRSSASLPKSRYHPLAPRYRRGRRWSVAVSLVVATGLALLGRGWLGCTTLFVLGLAASESLSLASQGARAALRGVPGAGRFLKAGLVGALAGAALGLGAPLAFGEGMSSIGLLVSVVSWTYLAMALWIRRRPVPPEEPIVALPQSPTIPEPALARCPRCEEPFTLTQAYAEALEDVWRDSLNLDDRGRIRFRPGASAQRRQGAGWCPCCCAAYGAAMS